MIRDPQAEFSRCANFGFREPLGTDREDSTGTLHVDVVDVEQNQLIWEGISVERLSGHDLTFEPENIMPSLVQIFADFPRRRLSLRE